MKVVDALQDRPAVSPTKTQAHAPLRSLDQRMDALKRANDVRVKRAKLKKDLKEGKIKIETDPRQPARVRLDREGHRHPDGGTEVRARQGGRFLNTCKISPSKTVGGLSDRQRTELIGLFNSR